MKIADTVKSSRMIAVIAILACAAVAAYAATAETGNNVDKAVAEEEAARKVLFDDLKKQREDALKLQKDGKFEEANRIFNSINERLDGVPGTYAKDVRKQNSTDILDLRDAWSAAIIKEARAIAATLKFEDAIALAATASVVDVRRNEEVNKFKVYCQEKIADRDYVAATNIKNFNPTYIPNQEKIKNLLLEAQIYFNNGRYSDAVEKLEEIYVLDPLNSKASFLLDKAYSKIYNATINRQAAQGKSLSAAGTWTWIIPVSTGKGGDRMTRQVEVKVTGNSLLERMEGIVFPQVEFENSDILSALRYLQKNSKEYDALGQGITIIPQLQSDKSADSSVTRELPLVSMNFTNIPLIDVIRYLCQDTGMNFRIDTDSVIIGYGVESADMQTRSFSVTPALYGTMMGGESSGEASTPTASGALTSTASTAASTSSPADSGKLKEYFVKRGIEFGEGAQVSYNARTSKMTVRNTAANLRRIEDLIRQLSVIATPMVMTEIKMVKITETDLDQLGFQWDFLSTSADSKFPNMFAGTSSNAIRTGAALQSLMDLFPEKTGLITDLKLFPNIFNSSADVNLSFSINALSQHSAAEVLSAPKLISTSGVEATIKMVDSTRYPESWEKPEITTSGDNNASVSLPLPNFGDYTETGIELRLTPTVNPDNYTIKLNLHPKVTTVVRGGDASSDNTYGVIIDRGYYSDTGEKVSYSDYPQIYFVWLPEFDEQSLDVTMKVFDGETVVFGGITSGSTVRVEDKMPFLGDIPFVGRLFASKSEQNIKTNLIFFVTARLLNSDGQPMRRSENRGVPQFNR